MNYSVEIYEAAKRLQLDKQRSDWFKKYPKSNDPPCPFLNPYSMDDNGHVENYKTSDERLLSDAWLANFYKCSNCASLSERLYGHREIWTDSCNDDAKKRAQSEADEYNVPVSVNVHGTRMFTAQPNRVLELEHLVEHLHAIVKKCHALVPHVSNTAAIPIAIEGLLTKKKHITINFDEVEHINYEYQKTLKRQKRSQRYDSSGNYGFDELEKHFGTGDNRLRDHANVIVAQPMTLRINDVLCTGCVVTAHPKLSGNGVVIVQLNGINVEFPSRTPLALQRRKKHV